MTFRVERADQPDPARDALAAHFGWAHLHTFERLVAEEEGIDLSAMFGYGGTGVWTEVDTPLRPLFDGRLTEAGRLSSGDCVGLQPRLRLIGDSWSDGVFAGDADGQMKLDQAATLRDLISVVPTFLIRASVDS